MTTVLLVRHARTAWTGSRYAGISDPPLDDDGRGEARAVSAAIAADLAGTFAARTPVITSPRRRARDTAAAIALALGAAPPIIDERWREADFGIAEGLTFEGIEAVDPALASALAEGATEVDWPGGETTADLAARVESALAGLAAAAVPAIVVTHAGPMRLAIARATGLPTADVDLPSTGTVIAIEL